MRGDDNRTGELLSYVDLKAGVSRDHPATRDPGDRERDAGRVGAGLFGALFADRASFNPPEKLLRVMLLQTFHWIRSARL